MPTTRPSLSRLLAATAVLAAVTLAPPVVLGAPALAGSANDSGPAVHHDTSAPLRTMKPAADGHGGARYEHRDKREEGLPQHPSSNGPDGALQTAPATASSTSSPTGFAGVGNGFSGPAGTYSVNSAPPDPNLAVGATQVVQVVNQAFAVFDKTSHAVLQGPLNTNTLWSGFGGGCQANNDGDGVVRYDGAANRWVVAQFSVSTSPYLMCVAVSTSNDATGSWYRYSFAFSSFPDYPKLGVWPGSYVTTYNLFNGNTFRGAEACAWPRDAMLAGGVASQLCATTSSAYGGLLPSDQDGSTPPPAGTPNTLLALGTTSTTLAAWQFAADWSTTPGTLSFSSTPTTLTVASYNPACGGGTCIPQSGTSNQLDSLGDRLMNRLAYRNFGTYQSWVVSHSVTAGSAVGVRWYELRDSGSGLTVSQQGTWGGSDGNYRWMPSIAQDKAGDLAVGYSVSSSTRYPSIALTGRSAGDAAGTMTLAESVLKAGGGAQVSYPWQALHRWGDYTAMALDPVDDCTFWYTDEYLASNGQFNWSTWLSSFTFDGCGSTVAPPDAPSGLTATPMSSSEIDLSWTGSTTATSYDVSRDGSVVGSATGTTYKDTGLASSSTHTYTVAARNAGGPSTTSAGPVSATTLAGPPPAPTGLTGTGSRSSVTLNWNSAPGATSYQVWRATSSTGPFSQVGSPSVTTFTLSGLPRRTSYWFYVKAVNGNGTSPPSGTIKVRTT